MYLATQLVLLDTEVTDPETAIRVAGDLLVAQGCATPSYTAAMLDAFRTLGPYIVLAPHIALPHARPEFGGLKNAVSIVRPRQPIIFGHPQNDPVKLVVALTGADDGSHITLLSRLARVLGDAQAYGTLLTAADPEVIVDLFIKKGG